jgi:hypothetical protein
VHAGRRPPNRDNRPDPGSCASIGTVSQNSTAWYDELDIVLGEPTHRTSKLINGAGAYRSKCSGIPRKEVIQPQLPLRLPCYDFTPIIDPTFDGCLPEG